MAKVDITAVNTAKGSSETNRRTGEVIFTPRRDSDDNILYTDNIRIKVIDPSADYQLPATLSASKVSKIAESFDKLRTVEGVDYRLREDSVSVFKATDSKPTAFVGTYVPASKTVSIAL